MSNMNGKTTKKIRQSMIIQHGEFCKLCGKFPPEADVFLNRIDRDETNNSPDNFQFLCRPCIAFRNKVDEHDDLCVKQKTEEGTAITINREKQPKFYKFVYDLLDKYKKLPYKELMYSGAEYLDLSPATTERYLQRMISAYGKLEKDLQDEEQFVMYKHGMDRNSIQKTY